jgi:tRNA pseudouridine38-40 synthase
MRLFWGVSRTFLAILHFDGSGFVGWQRQKSGRSVQGEVEAVLEKLNGRRIPVHAAGRTDAGVHARGMGISLTVPSKWTATTMRRALNALLPKDCWIERVQEMISGFHARKSATARRYHYLIGTDEASNSPFRRPYEWPLARELDRSILRDGAEVLLGAHEFRAFAARGEARPHYRCLVRMARWTDREGAGVRFEIEADRFLHHMVRFLVGTMVDMGLGRRPAGDMTTLLARSVNDETSPPAPPQGLYFIAAEYPKACFVDQREAPDD